MENQHQHYIQNLNKKVENEQEKNVKRVEEKKEEGTSKLQRKEKSLFQYLNRNKNY